MADTNTLIESLFTSPPAPLDWTEDQREHFHAMQKIRPSRSQLRILIVEDQMFSGKLLHGMLHTNYMVDITQTMKQGWELYLEKAPDIAFIDITLENDNGHDLARRIKDVDLGAYVVMVTANNKMEEIKVAKENKVDGFIVKPYNKQQILTRIDQYIAKRKAQIRKGSCS